jgi:tetratricopeptide (TPR) repeat protein
MKKLFLPLVTTTLLLAGCASQPGKQPAASAAVVPAMITPKIELLNSQIKANPNDPQTYSNRGYVLALLGQKEAARADLRKVIELKDNGPMRNRVGWAYFNNGDYAEAVAQFEKAAALSEHRARYDYYSLVLGYWGVKDFKKAMENYQLAVEREPKFGEYKTLQERIAEWTPLEKQAMEEVYILWSKAFKPQ